jgi:hypothetical protein
MDFSRRFRRGDNAGAGNPQQRPGGNVAVDERGGAPPPPPPPAATTEPAAPAARAEPTTTVRTAPAPRELRARQRDEFGGFNWGAAFFGWLVAVGLGALLTAFLAGAGTALSLTDVPGNNASVETIGIGGGILLLVVAMIAYYCGGYVAGRMSRFDGARQGFGVWVFGLIATVAIAAAGWIFGDKYNLLDRLNLPRIPVHAGDLTTGGLVALAAIVVGTLIAAVVGGTVGRRYHDRVDRAGDARY